MTQSKQRIFIKIYSFLQFVSFIFSDFNFSYKIETQHRQALVVQEYRLTLTIEQWQATCYTLGSVYLRQSMLEVGISAEKRSLTTFTHYKLWLRWWVISLQQCSLSAKSK